MKYIKDYNHSSSFVPFSGGENSRRFNIQEDNPRGYRHIIKNNMGVPVMFDPLLVEQQGSKVLEQLSLKRMYEESCKPLCKRTSFLIRLYIAAAACLTICLLSLLLS